MITLIVAGAVSLVLSLLLTPVAIRLFTRLGWGQPIRVDGPTTHHIKRGTPTMGGLVFIACTLVGYVVGHLIGPGLPISLSAALVMLMMVGHGAVGFVDDFTKTRRQRSLGLGGWQKVTGQVIVSSVFALLALQFPDPQTGLTPASTAISITRDVPWTDLTTLGLPVAVGLALIWINLLAVAASNGVNVTDGQDGLATGSSILALSAFVFIGFFQSSQSCQSATRSLEQQCFVVRDPLDLAVIATALTGSLIGFLWWNAPPAKIIMGDTGALGLGGSLAALAVLTRTELLLIVIGGLFCVITGSVIVQRAYFKLTGGKRIFLMSPLHHHFELKGWAEVTITIRFWIIAGVFMSLGVVIFYASWLGS
ncbi:MAG: phospho-N-acetylmuramoyl-pentapeptide-transferase [Propionibacteriaceae bacterium]